MSNIKNSETSWPAWKVALAIGVPVVAGGIGYYMYTKSKKKPEKPVDGKKEIQSDVKSSPSSSKVNNNNNQKTKSPPEQNKYQQAVELKNEGNTLFKNQKFAEAIEKYEKAIGICPREKWQDLSTFYQNKAAAHEKLKQSKEVVEACSKAIELNPRYVKALFRRSRALELLGRKTECLEDMTAVCIMEQFQNSTSMLFADRVLKDIGKEEAAKVFATRKPFMPSAMFVKQYFSSFTNDGISSPLTKEEGLIENCGYINAKKAMEDQKLDDVIPNCTITINNCLEENKTQSSGTGETTVTNQKPRNNDELYLANAYLLRGTFHLLMGNTNAAKPDLEMVINMENANKKLIANALIKRGSLGMQEQNTEEAKKDFDLAVKADPDNTDVLHHRGQLHVLLEKLDDAILDFKKCIELKPDFALAHAQNCFSVYRKAFTSRDIVETTKAFAAFEDIIKQFPNCAEIYGLYAQALTDREEFAKADEMFAKAIAIEPDNATQYVHRGLLALQWKQNMNESVKYIEEALKLDDKCDFAHETMGTIEVQRGNLDKACKHFGIAIDLAKSETEMAHLFSLKAAAIAQGNLAVKYGLKPPSMPQ